jgi:hypothetical protein
MKPVKYIGMDVHQATIAKARMGVHCESNHPAPSVTRVILGWLLETRVFLSTGVCVTG